MRSIYNPINTSVSVHDLSKLSMGSSTYFEEGRKATLEEAICLMEEKLTEAKIKDTGVL